MNTTEAFVLGAGLGIRLRPLTDELPKPLVPIFGKPLITFAFDHLLDAGITQLVVNTHRLPGKFRETFPESAYRDHRIVLVHEPELLGTGGGLRNVLSHFRAASFAVYSGDILADFALAPLFKEHERAGNDVTLALRRTRFRPSISLEGNRVTRIGENGDYDFANVSVWRRQTVMAIPSHQSVSFIPTLVAAIARGGKLGGVVVDDGEWFNIGSASDYLAAHCAIAQQRWRPAYSTNTKDWPQLIASDAMVDASATLSGFHALGAGCRVGADAKLTDTILWPRARVAPGSQLRNCVVRSGRLAEGILQDAIV